MTSYLFTAEGAGILLLLVATLLLAAGAVGWAAATRRRFVRDSRELIDALETLRAGRTPRGLELDPASPLSLVGDSVRRFAHELQATRRAAEHAATQGRALADGAAHVAVVVTDEDGDIRAFSAGATALFGWEEHEVLARPATVLLDESAYRELLPKLARRSLREQGVSARATLRRRDGSAFEADILVRGLSSGAPGFALLARDVSEHVRMERELQGSEQRHRELIEGLIEGVLLIQEGKIVLANPAAQTLLGRSQRELIGQALRDFVATRDVIVVEAALGELTRRGVGEFELGSTLRGPEGTTTLWVRLRGRATLHGGRPAVLVLLQDQSARERVEAELRCSEARLDAVLESATDGILVLGERTSGALVRVANRAFAEMLGWRPAELLGLSVEQLLPRLRTQGPLGGVIAAQLEAEPGTEPHVETLAIVEPEAKDFEVAVAALTGPGGVPLGRVLVCRDRSDSCRAERELQAQAERLALGKVELEQANRRLQEANAAQAARGEDLARLNEELRRLDEMKTKLIGNVSHELQTPLVSIRGYTEMILKERLGPITAEQRKGLTLALQSVDRLIAMIDNLLDLSRPDGELGRLELRRFALQPLVDEVRGLLREPLETRGLRLQLDLPETELWIHADRDKVLQVFLNLLSNAIKHSPYGSEVLLHARMGHEGYATVRLRDRGPGIPREMHGRIFERHFQVRSSVGTKPEGRGLGLAIVRDILRMHGCTVSVESEEGKGAEFVFTLPQGQDQPQPTSQSSTREEASAAAPETASLEPRALALRPRFRVIRHGKPEGSGD